MTSIVDDLALFDLITIPKARVNDILSHAFRNDAFHRYVLTTWSGQEQPGIADIATNLVFFDELLTQLQHEGAFFISIKDSTLAMVCQPVIVGSNPPKLPLGDFTPPEALVQMEEKSNEVLNRLYQPGQTILHIYLIGKDRRPGSNVLGSKTNARDLLRQVKKFAAYMEWPLYLEATSPYSRDIFMSVGFRVAEEVKVGIGQVDTDGLLSDRGCGVSLFVATLAHDKVVARHDSVHA